MQPSYSRKPHLPRLLSFLSAWRNKTPGGAASGTYSADPKGVPPGYPIAGSNPAALTILPSPQRSTGTTQSRRHPARAGKVMESAGHHTKGSRRGHGRSEVAKFTQRPGRSPHSDFPICTCRNHRSAETLRLNLRIIRACSPRANKRARLTAAHTFRPCVCRTATNSPSARLSWLTVHLREGNSNTLPTMPQIPDKFHKGQEHPTAENVGQLKALLSELPDDLRIEVGFGYPAELVVYNYGTDEEHLEFIEAELE